MSQHISMITLLGVLGLAAACGSDHVAVGTGGALGAGGTVGLSGTGGAVDAAPPPIVQPACVSGENTICLPSGFSFVKATFAHSNTCNGICPAASPVGPWTILLSQPQAGTLCMSGTNPDPTGTGLALSFPEFGQLSPGTLMVLKRFNADLLNITQVRFTIDSPPSGGISVSATTLNSDVCNGNDCRLGFALPNRITASGTTTASLVDFISDWNPPKPVFDTRALDTIDFAVGPGDFDFCVHDFQFLDANGAVVLPKP